MLTRTHTPKHEVFGTSIPNILRFAYFTPEQIEAADKVELVVRNQSNEVIWHRFITKAALMPHLKGGIKHSNGRNDNLRLIVHADERTAWEIEGILTTS